MMNPGSGALGQISRVALPGGGDVDAFVVLYGDVRFLHAAGLPTPGAEAQGVLMAEFTKDLTAHDAEIAYVVFNVDIIDAKSHRTIVRKAFPPSIERIRVPGGWGLVKLRYLMVAKGDGAKERAEPDWICRNPLTEEKKQALKEDFQAVIQGELDEALPILRLTRRPEQQTQ
jgi:hypothetical protein